MDDFGLKCLAASAAPAVAARATGRGGHAHPGGMAVCRSIAGFIGAGLGLLARAGPAEAYPGGIGVPVPSAGVAACWTGL